MKRSPFPPQQPTADEVERRTVRIPHDPVNERVVLAAAVVGSAAERKELILACPADGFRGRGMRAAWEFAVVELDRRGLSYDPATVRQLSGGVVDTDLIDALVRERPEVPPNLDAHVRWFLWDRERCQCVDGPLPAFLDALMDQTSDPDRVRALAAELGRAFSGGGPLPFLRDSQAVVEEMHRRLHARRTAQGWRPFGIDGLDYFEARPGEERERRIKLGLAPRHMTLVVGMSGNNKTTLVNQVVLAQAKLGRRVLHGGWEEDAEDNLEMLAGFSLNMSRARRIDGKITDKEEACLVSEAELISKYVKSFDLPFTKKPVGKDGRRPRVYNADQMEVIERHVAASGCDVVVYDLFKAALTELGPQEEERALRDLLEVCKRTRTHALVVHHLRKGDRDEQGARPTRESVKGAYSWVEIFDTILATHWPHVYSRKYPAGKLEVLVLKQRKGRWPLGIELDYDVDTGVVSGGRDVEYHTEDDDGLGSGMKGFLGDKKKY